MGDVSIKDLSIGQMVYVVDFDQRYGYQEEAVEYVKLLEKYDAN